MRTFLLGLALAFIPHVGLCQQTTYIPNFAVTFGSRGEALRTGV